jgi:hypothetical protein
MSVPLGIGLLEETEPLQDVLGVPHHPLVELIQQSPLLVLSEGRIGAEGDDRSAETIPSL